LIRFVRADLPGLGARVGRIVDSDTVHVLDHDDPLRAIRGAGETVRTVPLVGLELLPPIEAAEIWCARRHL